MTLISVIGTKMKLNWVLSLNNLIQTSSLHALQFFLYLVSHQFGPVQGALNSGFPQAAAQLYK